MRYGFLFPGQGAQFVGMGASLAREFETAARMFAVANEVMGIDLCHIMWEGPEDVLRQTRITQPAILAHSLAAWSVVRELLGDDPPAVAAGHSLGEFGALVAAGVLTATDALRIVKRRGELMHDAGVTNPGAMAALLGIDEDRVKDVLENAKEAGVVVAANLNAPDQTVVSGTREAVARAMDLAAQAGAKRVVPLAVSGAFHSPLMAGVAQELADVVAEVSFHTPACPVTPNVTARPTVDPEELRRCLLLQIERPVRWCESMRAMISAGTTSFLELGPGRVLAGLAKRIDRSVSVESIGDPESVAVLRHVAASRGSVDGDAP